MQRRVGGGRAVCVHGRWFPLVVWACESGVSTSARDWTIRGPAVSGSGAASSGTLAKPSADLMMAAVFAAVGDSLAKGEPVSIAGFGTFTTKSRPARQGRNPRTGEAIAIAASTAPAFKSGKALRDAVNAGAA